MNARALILAALLLQGCAALDTLQPRLSSCNDHRCEVSHVVTSESHYTARVQRHAVYLRVSREW